MAAGGVLASFWGLLMTGLLDMSALSMRYSGQAAVADVTVSKGSFIFTSLLTALAGYAVSMVLLYLLCRSPQQQARFPAAIIVNNWASVVVSAALLPLSFLAALTPVQAGGDAANLTTIIFIAVLAALCIAGTRILRIALDLAMGKAFAWFCLTSLASLTTIEILEQVLKS